MRPGVLGHAVVDLDRAPRVVEVAEEVGEDLAGPRRLVAGVGEQADLVGAAAQRGGADRRGLAEAVERGVARPREAGQVEREPVEVGRGRAQVREQRRVGPGDLVELGERRLQLGEEVVEDLEVAREVVAARERGVGRVGRALDEVDDVLAALGQLADHPVGVRR